MTKKCEVRQAIENILGINPLWVYIDYRGKRVNPNDEKDHSYTKYRMKLPTRDLSVLTLDKKALILSLPGVTKVGYTKDNPASYSRCGGITVHFNCKPKSIKLDKIYSSPLKENKNLIVLGNKGKVYQIPSTTENKNASIIAQLENIIEQLKEQK